jgi:hypothetical protein
MLGIQAAAVEVPHMLAGFDERGATVGDLVEALADAERAMAWLSARQADLLAELAARPAELPAPAGVAPHAPAAVEAGARLRWAPATADPRVAEALHLVGRLPATLAALRSGRIDAAKARAIVAATQGLDDGAAAAVEARALRRADAQTLPQLRAVLRRAVLAFGPAAAERAVAAREQRRVVITPTGDGMAELCALLSAPDAAAIGSVLQGASLRAAADDLRTSDQRRADALVELIAGERKSWPRPQVSLTMPITALLGLDDEPAELAGVGPIPVDLARELAGDATWRRILTDPTSGAVLDVGRTRYAPPAGLDRFVRTRDGRCRFPGCRRRAARCDLDHAIRFPDGPTAAGNLASC